jgi:Dyp-type peroxidase family
MLSQSLYGVAYKNALPTSFRTMSQKLQEGIYYLRKPGVGNSFMLLFLRAHDLAEASDVGKTMESLWMIYRDLKKGIIKNLNLDPRHRSSGNLSVLVGYGDEIFALKGVKKSKPADFDNRWLFQPPNRNGGGTILDGSEISYAPHIVENHAHSDHIVIQFIADNEFYTNRAIVETWKELYRLSKSNWGKSALYISHFYNGFQRADNRNWLGFHDGVSNLKSRERRYVISIRPGSLGPADRWVTNGTYLAFLRIYTDLQMWENIDVENQEIIVGRDKLSGCPLLSIDKKGKPVKDRRCPVEGTSEVIELGNEYFRDHPPYREEKDITGGTSGYRSLAYSHIGTMRPIVRIPVWNKKSSRIFRQGFEFLEYTKDYPNFRAGLNFVSFQNSPQRLFKTLTYRHIKASLYNEQEKKSPTLDEFLSVSAAGIFLAPPIKREESFPGASIFFDSDMRGRTMEYTQIR